MVCGHYLSDLQVSITLNARVQRTEEKKLQLMHCVIHQGSLFGLVNERLEVPIPAAAAGEFSSPELTVCADSYSVSVPPQCYRSGT